jgi:DNA repair photolyase
MGLNKSTGNMYKWITHTWNPLGGECPHACKYCSTNKLRKRYPVLEEKYSGELRLIEKELKTNLGSGNYIFVAAQNDLFTEEIPDEWIKKILGHCDKFDNFYLFQTKNPKNIRRILPYGSSVCITIETNRVYPDIMNNCPIPYERYSHAALIRHPLYITIEPIMDFDIEKLVFWMNVLDPIQINIGFDSGRNSLPEPSKEKTIELIKELSKFTKVVLKKNSKRILGKNFVL